MIESISKEKCCGCEACRQACPIKCIMMKEDEDEFLYPVTNTNCVGCGICLSVCPVNGGNV